MTSADAHMKVYVMSNQATGNSVTVFDRDDNGVLTQMGTYPTGGLGVGGVTNPLDSLMSQGSLTISEDRRFLFAVDSSSNEISVLAIDQDKLIAIDRVPSGGTFPVSVTVRQNLLYVLHSAASGNGASSVTGFTVAADGTLSALEGSTQMLAGGPGASAQVRFSPDGKQLVVTELANNLIDVLPVDDTGRAGAAVAHPSSGPGPFGFAFAGENLLIVSEVGDAAASSYRLGADGTLPVVSGSVPTAEEGACWVVVPNGTPDPRYAYVSNATAGTISGYRIDATGTLSLLTPSGHTAVTVDSNAAIDSAVSSDGRFLYVITGGFSARAERPVICNQMSISGYKIEDDGNLTTILDPNGNEPVVNGLAPGTQGIVAT